ncbi:MAG: cytochrome b/b6 domain-containing protein [Rhodospirillaceae bacterium]|nr:cytochrome b/b6 domain-containing protein [Rhodospirillaceae bacterium]
MSKTNKIIEHSANLTENKSGPARPVRVWDLPTRVFHWALVVMIAIAWISAEADGSAFVIHVYSGTMLVGFIMFRLVWGIIGSRHALFADFVFSWTTVKDYSLRLLSFRPPHSVGHNPLGGWMVVGLLAVIMLAILTGMMSSEDGYRGPLSHLAFGGMDDIHEGLANFLGLLIFIHVVGVFAHGVLTRENLPRAMITGIKKLPAGIVANDIRSVGIIRPIIAVLIGFGAIWLFWS